MPWPSLGHYQGGSLTHPMLIICVLHIWPEGHGEPCNEVGSLSLTECLVGFEAGTFWFWSQRLNWLGHSLLKKHILKYGMVLKDTCSKTVFFPNNIHCEQIDGVSIGSFLGQLLANIMSEMVKTILKRFNDDMVLFFYGRYVNNILVVIKQEYLKLVHDAFNNFGKNLNFTVDTFSNVVFDFLDIEIFPDGISIY